MNNAQRARAVEIIDTYLTYLGCADQPLREFDRCLVMTEELCDTGAVPEQPACWLDATAADLDFAWTVRVMTGQVRDETAMLLFENRTVPWGEVSRFAPRMPGGDRSFYQCFARHTFAGLYHDGRVERNHVYAGFRHNRLTIFDPSAWFADGLGVYSLRKDAVTERTINLLLGMAFITPMFWTAHVALAEGAPRVSLLTDPTGVKELWKFRDVPEGKARRDALLHWVGEHWRQNRHDPDVEGYVRRHLRGARVTRCAGLSITIEESADDRERLLEIVAQRKVMRQLRRDRRPLRPR